MLVILQLSLVKIKGRRGHVAPERRIYASSRFREQSEFIVWSSERPLLGGRSIVSTY